MEQVAVGRREANDSFANLKKNGTCQDQHTKNQGNERKRVNKSQNDDGLVCYISLRRIGQMRILLDFMRVRKMFTAPKTMIRSVTIKGTTGSTTGWSMNVI
jgi:hypothetical protein